MESVAIKYPPQQPIVYLPGSASVQAAKHQYYYQIAGPSGRHGIDNVQYTTPVKTRSINGYVMERGVPTYKFNNVKGFTARDIREISRTPRSGLVMRVVGAQGDTAPPYGLKKSPTVGRNMETQTNPQLPDVRIPQQQNNGQVAPFRPDSEEYYEDQETIYEDYADDMEYEPYANPDFNADAGGPFVPEEMDYEEGDELAVNNEEQDERRDDDLAVEGEDLVQGTGMSEVLLDQILEVNPTVVYNDGGVVDVPGDIQPGDLGENSQPPLPKYPSIFGSRNVPPLSEINTNQKYTENDFNGMRAAATYTSLGKKLPPEIIGMIDTERSSSEKNKLQTQLDKLYEDYERHMKKVRLNLDKPRFLQDRLWRRGEELTARIKEVEEQLKYY